jgi:hypothetical protein
MLDTGYDLQETAEEFDSYVLTYLGITGKRYLKTSKTASWSKDNTATRIVMIIKTKEPYTTFV